MSDQPRSPEDSDEIDSLGAAPTRPVGGSERTGSRRRPRLPRSGGGRRPLVRVMVVIGLVISLALMPAVFSSMKKTPRNRVGISYGGGPLEAAHFQKVVQPGSGLFFNGIGDPLYLYPADTQSYIVSKAKNEGDVQGVDSIVSPSHDRVQIEYQVAVYFKLNVDLLKDFHDQLGLQYAAYQNAGWNKLIQNTFRQQIENALQENTRQYDVKDIYGNADDLIAIQQDVEQKLSQRLTGALGQPFFCGPSYQPGKECAPPIFIIKKIEIPGDVVKAFEDNQTSLIKVATSQNQIAQREAEARSIEALNVGLSQAGMNYVLLRAIESGQINFWVLPSDSGLTLAPGATGEVPPATPDSTTTTTPGGG